MIFNFLCFAHYRMGSRIVEVSSLYSEVAVRIWTEV